MSIHDKITLRKVRHFLKHILYPIRTADLREMARSEGRGDDLVDLVSRLPYRTFKNADEVLEHLGPINVTNKKAFVRRAVL